MPTVSDRIAFAQADFEKGFLSEAARKRALDNLNRGYASIHDELMSAILAARTPETEKQNHADYWDIPSDLHHVRDRHFEVAARYSPNFAVVRDLIFLRAAIKGAEISQPPVKPEIELRAEAVRRSVVEELERRRAQFVEGLAVARLFGGLPVSVSAHIVHGHKGAVFVRHFFYLRGKLTPLNTILAVADAFEREGGGK
jgi:hypothetical protein